MQLDWIVTFLAVVDNQGFAAASETIYRSQSRVSSHVAALERELGTILLDRRQRPIELTAAGWAFVHHARQVLAEIEAGRAGIAAVQGLLRGSLSIASHPTGAVAFLPEVISLFHDRFPGVHVELVENHIRDLDDAVASGLVDVALRPITAAMRHPDLRWEPLWRERMQVVLPAGHRLAADIGPLELEELADEYLIVNGHDFLHQSGPYFSITGRSNARVAFVSDLPQTLVAFTRKGLGVGVTNQLAIALSPSTGVVVRDFADDDMYREVGIYWDPARETNAAVPQLLDVALTEASVPDCTIDIRRFNSTA